MRIEIDTTVRGGFPVTITAIIHPLDRSIGRYFPEAEIINITNRKGKPLNFLKLTDADYDHIREEILNAY